MNRYYVASGSERSGPFTIDELRTGVASTVLDANSLVWCQGMPEWTRAANVPDVAALLLERAPDAADRLAIPPVPPSRNSTTSSLIAPSAGDDFLLLNPRLPRMAQAICAYALLIGPAVAVLGCTSRIAFPEPHQQSTLPGDHAFWLLDEATMLLGWVSTAVVAYGGYQLRALRRRGAMVLKIVFAADAVLLVLVILMSVMLGVWQASVDSGADPSLAATTLDNVQVMGKTIRWLLDSVFFCASAWEIVCLVWLMRRGKSLPLV